MAYSPVPSATLPPWDPSPEALWILPPKRVALTVLLQPLLLSPGTAGEKPCSLMARPGLPVEDGPPLTPSYIFAVEQGVGLMIQILVPCWPSPDHTRWRTLTQMGRGACG